jgi:hypothetical protein
MDIVDQSNNSIRVNAITTSNVNPNSVSTLILNFVHNHKVSDEVKLRFGGGFVPGVQICKLIFFQFNGLLQKTKKKYYV